MCTRISMNNGRAIVQRYNGCFMTIRERVLAAEVTCERWVKLRVLSAWVCCFFLGSFVFLRVTVAVEEFFYCWWFEARDV